MRSFRKLLLFLKFYVYLESLKKTKYNIYGNSNSMVNDIEVENYKMNPFFLPIFIKFYTLKRPRNNDLNVIF